MKRGDWNETKTHRFWASKNGEDIWLLPRQFARYRSTMARSQRDWLKLQAPSKRLRKSRHHSHRAENFARYDLIQNHGRRSEVRHHLIRGRSPDEIAIKMGWPISVVKQVIELVRAEKAGSLEIDPFDVEGLSLIHKLDHYADTFGSWHLDDDLDSVVWTKVKPSSHRMAHMRKLVERAREHFDRTMPRRPGDVDWGIWRAIKDSRNFKPQTK